MAIKAFKDIIDNKGYRINSNDRKIFEEGNLESFFGFGEKDAIEFIVYDLNDNQLPQINDELVRYIPLNTQNIREYFLIPEGTVMQRYQFPTEYFIDIERLVREAGYDNGTFKTQITLINKRVGSDGIYDKLWISEISPSRTEVRLFPLKRGLQTNEELKTRFELFIENGEFRDDTINLAINFIEKITPTVIDDFLRKKYQEKWFNKMLGEFRINEFDTFTTKVYEKFIEACIYELTNRDSNPTSNNYGKPYTTKPSIELSVENIKDLCKRVLIGCINFYLNIPDSVNVASFDEKVDTSEDVVGRILQRLESDVIIDTSPFALNMVQVQKTDISSKLLKLNLDIKKQLPVEPPTEIERPIFAPPIREIPIEVVTPISEPPYTIPTPPIFRGGGGGGGRMSDFGDRNFGSGVFDRDDNERQNIQ
jgi:hypothetical protein